MQKSISEWTIRQVLMQMVIAAGVTPGVGFLFQEKETELQFTWATQNWINASMKAWIHQALYQLLMV